MGSAAVEAVLVTILVLVPLCSLLPGLAQVQRASLAAHAAAREAARVASSTDPAGASGAALAAARDVVAGHGFGPEVSEVAVSGVPEPDGVVTSEVRIRVALIGWANAPTVTVTGRGNGRVDPFGSR